jgi:hypothetical protein
MCVCDLSKCATARASAASSWIGSLSECNDGRGRGVRRCPTLSADMVKVAAAAAAPKPPLSLSGLETLRKAGGRKAEESPDALSRSRARTIMRDVAVECGVPRECVGFRG